MSNFRYPGWRVGWIVGPRGIVDQVGRAASAIDRGPPMATQRAAIEALAPARADQETQAVGEVFARKRGIMLEALTALGVRIPCPPRATFHVWACTPTAGATCSDRSAIAMTLCRQIEGARRQAASRAAREAASKVTWPQRFTGSS